MSSLRKAGMKNLHSDFTNRINMPKNTIFWLSKVTKKKALSMGAFFFDRCLT